MKTETQTVALDGTVDGIFDFLADPGNLPTWAVGFARAVRRDGDGWLVSTGHGEVRLRTAADRATGVIDSFIAFEPGVETPVYTRLLPTPSGALYVFNLIQPPGMSEDDFRAQGVTLREELEVLRHVLRARSNCLA